MTQNNTTTEYNVIERNGQLQITLNTEILIPEDAPVRLTDAQLEELDYRKLYAAFSSKGRNPVTDPRVLFKVLAYCHQIHIYSNRQIVDACKNRIDVIWLLGDEPVPDQSTIARFRRRCAEEIEDLFYQYVNYLEEQRETDHEVVFIDGTKLESRAGRYTFCWRGTVEKNLAKVKEKVLELTGLKTLSGLQKRLRSTKPTELVSRKGKRKSREQREWEELDALRSRWEQYVEALEVMGDGRNSYSKTDPDATFMRMKKDHMRNGQLKPAYNVQIAVNSEYITGIEVFSNRTDYKTMEPFLRQMKKKHRKKYKKVTADAGFESLDNYLYLEENGQMSFIKPQNHDIAKTKSFRSQIGRAENMRYDPEADTYTCAMGRRFLTRGKRNVRTELFLLGMGFNLKKLWNKRQAGRLKTHLSVLNSA